MAGIGFELRRLLRPRTFGGFLRAYAFAGLIGAGPWVLSVAGTTAMGALAGGSASPEVVRFLVAVTWLMAASLLLTGPLQLLFSRFISDRIWEDKRGRVAPNVVGALVVVSIAAAAFAGVVLSLLFPDEPFMVRLLLFIGLVAIADLWVVVIVLSGLKRYRTVLAAFAGGYGLSIGSALLLHGYGLPGLLAAFVLGQAALLFVLLGLVLAEFPGDELVSFDFLRPRFVRLDLALTGAFYNLGIWADKIVFWVTPATSSAVLGPLRYSVVYDLPIFLACLSVVPGSAVFLLRIETDFAESHRAFYDAVRQGGTLESIEVLKDGMVVDIRRGLGETLKAQVLAGIAFAAAGPALLARLGISPVYLPLFRVDLVGAGLQVLFVCALNVLFYFDQRKCALGATALFVAANLSLSLGSIALGPQWYGYGFTLAAGLAAATAFGLLARTLQRLEYATFMLQE